MPPGAGESTPGHLVDGDGPKRRRRLCIRRSTEIKNPTNLMFERYVAEKERQIEQEQMTAAIVGSLAFTVYLENSPDVRFEDGESTWNDDYDICGTSRPLLLHENSTQQGEERLVQDSAKPLDDTDFLEGTNFFKKNSDKQKASTRNKKNSKKHKRKKGKAKGRKQSHATEMQSKPPTEPCSSCASVTSGQTLASSSSRVAVSVPQLELEYSSSSSGSRVKAKLTITPAVKSASSGNEKELSASINSSDGFKSFKSTTSSYATATSSSVNDYAGSLSDARSERSLSASDSTDRRGFQKMSSEGSFGLAISPGGNQEASPCSYYSRNDGDFQQVVSRKAARKLKKMQRQSESPAPCSMAASGSGPAILTREPPVPRAPFLEVITIGHYINKETFYGRKPNQKKGKYQKARNLSDLSKPAGCTDGENVSGSKTTLVIAATVHQAKPGSSSHHVTLEAIKETDSPSCLLKEGELKAMAPVGDGIQDTDSKAPSYCKPSSLGNLADSSCVEKEEENKAVALVDVDTEDKDPRAPTSSKTLSLGHLVNSSCVNREQVKKKAMDPVDGGTKDINSRAPTSDKTSSLGHLIDSSCVDREHQLKNAMLSPGGSDTKDTDSRAVFCDKTMSLNHLAISSCADSQEQKKEENRIEFSTHASSELDKIIKAANSAYEIQAASDVYMISGIYADIDNFLHAATPVIGQISCTESNIRLQDQRLWSVWSWYEEPECCGIEVQMQGKTDSMWPEFSTYFQPLLSAVQLFGQSGKSQNHGGLVFEYFESGNPFSRPPIFTKIKQIRDGINLSGSTIFGDPKQLECVKLSDLHPASWFCVAWYPICQIPAAAGRCKASFLTYHTLGKLVPQTCPMDGGHDRIICPIVGLLGYKDQEEKWFQLRQQLRFGPRTNVFSETDHAELLNKRLRTLRQGASIMSKAVVPRASGEAMNCHKDYEFFRSRSL